MLTLVPRTGTMGKAKGFLTIRILWPAKFPGLRYTQRGKCLQSACGRVYSLHVIFQKDLFMNFSRCYDRNESTRAKRMHVRWVPGMLVLVATQALWPIRVRGRLERVHPV